MQEKKHPLELEVQFADPRLESLLPEATLRTWVDAALLGPAELTIRFVDVAEGQALNLAYRGKDYATNVLTFAYNEDEDLAEDDPVKADIVLCTDVLQREADEQAGAMTDGVSSAEPRAGGGRRRCDGMTVASSRRRSRRGNRMTGRWL